VRALPPVVAIGPALIERRQKTGRVGGGIDEASARLPADAPASPFNAGDPVFGSPSLVRLLVAKASPSAGGNPSALPAGRSGSPGSATGESSPATGVFEFGEVVPDTPNATATRTNGKLIPTAQIATRSFRFF
jgi:hypothetical protein